MRKPSVVIIQADQWNARCLSYMGNPNVQTPHLDKLAQDGVIFTQARCNNSICMPSRASMFSGQYCATNHQYGFNGELPIATPLIQRSFKLEGYRTGAFGKFHTLCMSAARWDFDVAAPTLPEDEDLARPLGNHYRAYCKGKGIPWPTDQQHGHNPRGRNPGFPSSASTDSFWMLRHSQASDVTETRDSLEYWTTDQALAFLDEDSETPFFMWLSYDRPHYPTTLPKEWFDRLDPAGLKLPAYPDVEVLSCLPEHIFQDYAHGTSIYNVGENDFRFIVDTYYKNIELIDHEIGRFVEGLKSGGLYDTTIIVFTSDHGDEAGYRGLYDKINGVSSEEIVKVPLIIKPAPCEKKPSPQCDAPVELVDLFPTLCEMANVPAPGGLDGESLAPGLACSSAWPAADRPQICEDTFARSIVCQHWKLVYDTREAWCQLYDLSADEDCMHNLYGDARFLEKQVQLKAGMLRFLAERIWGKPSHEDHVRFKQALDPEHPSLAYCLSDRAPVTVFGGAVEIYSHDIFLLVPRFDRDEPLWLFRKSANDGYFKASDSLNINREVLDRLLDIGLNYFYDKTFSVSVFRPRLTIKTPVSLSAARTLISKHTSNAYA
ncbi:MAG: sulfatase-like hydrolase/transferase [Verrucomicrobiota bacterium JB024]|nr:sulfatase-like hydrolase/transferase [Verrucomicrobiota bacterium JB024]